MMLFLKLSHSSPCLDFLWKKPAAASSHSGPASSRRWTPSVPAYCHRLCCTCLLELNSSTCEGKPCSTRLLFLEKIHLTWTHNSEMSQFIEAGDWFKCTSRQWHALRCELSWQESRSSTGCRVPGKQMFNQSHIKYLQGSCSYWWSAAHDTSSDMKGLRKILRCGLAMA